jgi:signal transduction histidine kinase
MAVKNSDSLKIADCLKNIGIVFYFKEDLQQSSEYYFQALAYLNENKPKHFELISRLNNNLGWNFERTQNFKQAEERYRMAISFSQRSEEKQTLALIYNNLGVLYKNIGEYEKAVESYKRSYEINSLKNNMSGQLQNLNNIAIIYIDKEKYDEAFQYLSKALRINYELGNEREIVNNLENIGLIYGRLKLYDAARDSTLKALDIAQRIDFGEGMIGCYLLLSDIEEQKGNVSEALKYYKSYHNLNDSIYRQEQNKLIIESETKYQTLKKEKENEILRQESILSESKLRQSKLNNLLILVGLILSILLVILLFLLLSSKQRTNTKLNALNIKIQNQNEEIQNQAEELRAANEQVGNQNLELKKSLEKLKLAQNQLIQTEKMASLGVLSAGIGHEINNPLNFINGGVETMMKYLEEHDKKILEKVRPYAEIIDEGVKRAASIVKSLSNFSRQTANMDEVCDIHNIIDNCFVMLHNRTKNRIEIKKDYCDKKLKIPGNVGKLHQVFLNLLSNSEQAIENKGKISVQTKCENDQVIIYICDTGKGIPEDHLSKINDPFFTTKDPGAGTGLGLSITYSIIRKHNGSIDFKSKLNEGTTFIVKLPLK